MRGIPAVLSIIITLPGCGCSEHLTGEPDAQDTVEESEARDGVETPPEEETWVAYTGPDYPRRYGRKIAETADGGLVFAGFTEEVGRAVWVVKVNDGESVGWSRYIQVESGDSAWVEGIARTDAGGFAVFGTTFDLGLASILLLELDAEGHPVRQRTCGEIEENRGLDIVRAGDGGYLVAGMLEGVMSSGTPWIARLDENLDLAWQKRFSGMHVDDIGGALEVAQNGDVLFAGKDQGTNTAWICRLDADGEVIWQRVIHDWAGTHSGADVAELTDGDIALTLPSDGGTVMRFDAEGTLLWQRALFGEWTNALARGEAGQILVGGCEFDLAGTGPDMWLLGLDTDGAVLWQKAVLISPEDTAYQIIRTSDGAMVAISGGCCSTGLVKLTAGGDFLGDCHMVQETASVPADTSHVVEEGDGVMEEAHLSWTDGVATEIDAPTSIHVECRGP